MTVPVEETLAREAEQRPRVVAAAIAAGVLTLAGNVLLALVTRGGPTESDGFISLTESLGAAVSGTPPADQSLLVRQVDFYGDHVALLSLSTVLTTIGAFLAALVLLFLHEATAARTDAVGRVPRIAVIGGLTLFPVGHLMREIGAWIGAAGFSDEAERTAQTAREVFSAGPVGVGSLLEVLGSFALALAFVLVSLNAMRVGLLTRFVGILGIIVGVLTVFQLDQPQIVRAFWLVFVGMLIAGRTRTGAPPAWQTGRAEPWPSQQQLRERREAAAAATSGGPTTAPSEGDAPSAQKRKRKRRR